LSPPKRGQEIRTFKTEKKETKTTAWIWNGLGEKKKMGLLLRQKRDQLVELDKLARGPEERVGRKTKLCMDLKK